MQNRTACAHTVDRAGATKPSIARASPQQQHPPIPPPARRCAPRPYARTRTHPLQPTPQPQCAKCPSPLGVSHDEPPTFVHFHHRPPPIFVQIAHCCGASSLLYFAYCTGWDRQHPDHSSILLTCYQSFQSVLSVAQLNVGGYRRMFVSMRRRWPLTILLVLALMMLFTTVAFAGDPNGELTMAEAEDPTAVALTFVWMLIAGAWSSSCRPDSPSSKRASPAPRTWSTC